MTIDDDDSNLDGMARELHELKLLQERAHDAETRELKRAATGFLNTLKGKIAAGAVTLSVVVVMPVNTWLAINGTDNIAARITANENATNKATEAITLLAKELEKDRVTTQLLLERANGTTDHRLTKLEERVVALTTRLERVEGQ